MNRQALFFFIALSITAGAVRADPPAGGPGILRGGTSTHVTDHLKPIGQCAVKMPPPLPPLSQPPPCKPRGSIATQVSPIPGPDGAPLLSVRIKPVAFTFTTLDEGGTGVTMTPDPASLQPVSTVLLAPTSPDGRQGVIFGVLQLAIRLRQDSSEASSELPLAVGLALNDAWAAADPTLLPPGASNLILFATIENGQWVARPRCLAASPLPIEICLAPPPELIDRLNGLP
jgi:hypothetical protein